MTFFFIILSLGLVFWFLIQSFKALVEEQQDSKKLSAYLFRRVVLSITLMILLFLAGSLHLIPAKSTPFVIRSTQSQ